MDSFTGDREYLIDGSLDCPNGYRSNDRGSMKRSSSFPAKNQAICREIPVKETTQLTRGEVYIRFRAFLHYIFGELIGILFDQTIDSAVKK